MKDTSNNYVKLLGKVDSELEFSHECFGEKFYTFDLAVNRLSETKDIIPVLISERFPEFSQIKENVNVYVEGEYRSYNKDDNGKNRLLLRVFVKEISLAEDYDMCMLNSIMLKGYICKQVIYRNTLLGREIADMLLAVNRPYGKADYIPCIAWGRNARWAENLQVGDELKIYGRVQSREYLKRLSDDASEKKTAYEVSIAKIEEV